jgi:predicted nucleic acid-binding protein
LALFNSPSLRDSEHSNNQQAQRARLRERGPHDRHRTIQAVLFSKVRAAGTPIPTIDLRIASLALQNDLVLFSRDTQFDCVPRLARI